ncbi:DUF126 domain-containing protein [Vulcanisaeta sp. JCM 16159]|uniref:aconitase X swivel domain-containing protein n=1 Tax=Vulcanisaeta sp. JCM 16159 TaxID=1295371 RepID=UPI000B008234|nr:DUF126 domain-containing protein [Vulcanisaeta sp. JCM 16159]
MKFKGETVFGNGIVSGELVVYREPLSFLGDVDGRNGVIRTISASIVGKVLVIPSSRGSTVGPYVMYQLSKYGKAPLVILSVKADTMLIIGAVMAQIPIMTNLPRDILNLSSGAIARVDLDRGEVYVNEPEARLALLLLEELELRNGKAKLKYLKVYRMMTYWLGPSYAKAILDRLVSSGYIVIKGDRAELIRRFKTNKNHSQIYRGAREIIINAYLSTQRPPNK